MIGMDVIRLLVNSCNNVTFPYFYILIFTAESYNSVGSLLWRKILCFSHDVHVTLSRNCKYVSFNLDVPCLNVILTNFMQNITVCLVYYREAWGFANHPKESICITYTLIDKCKNC